MGSVLTARCECGYNKLLKVGYAMLSMGKSCYFPFYCQKCAIIFEGNYLKSQENCPKCRSKKVIPFDHSDLQKVKGTKVLFYIYLFDQHQDKEGINDGFYFCPICCNYTLQFVEDQYMDWD